MATSKQSVHSFATDVDVLSGPIRPPGTVQSGPIRPPGGVSSGPIRPPKHNQRIPLGAATSVSGHGFKTPIDLVSQYQSNVGLGGMLHAVDQLDYTTFVQASRKADRAAIKATLKGHADEVARLARMDGSLRMLLARTPLMSGIVFDLQGANKASLTVGSQVIDVAYPSSRAKDAVEQVLRELPMGEINIAYIMAEAEHPSWPFIHALGLHRAEPAAAFGYTGHVLDIINDVVVVPVHQLKHALQVKRPWQMDKAVRPWIPTPLHASFPSGHATFAHAAATVLNGLVGPKDPNELLALASAVARRRELAGVHTGLDSAIGQQLGEALGIYLLDQALRSTSKAMATWRALFAMAALEWTAD
jgi:hypothetical protein